MFLCSCLSSSVHQRLTMGSLGRTRTVLANNLADDGMPLVDLLVLLVPCHRPWDLRILHPSSSCSSPNFDQSTFFMDCWYAYFLPGFLAKYIVSTGQRSTSPCLVMTHQCERYYSHSGLTMVKSIIVLAFLVTNVGTSPSSVHVRM